MLVARTGGLYPQGIHLRRLCLQLCKLVRVWRLLWQVNVLMLVYLCEDERNLLSDVGVDAINWFVSR